MVDASFVEIPVQRNSREDNDKIKEGKVPEDLSEEKRRQKDTDACWTKHNEKNHFGYKNHVKADTETKLITAFKVTSAKVHDSHMIESLLEKEDAGEPIYADSAYRSESIDQMYVNRACLKTLKPTSNKEKDAKFAVLNA